MRKLLFFIILLGCSMFANAELDLGTPGTVGINFETVVSTATTNYTALNVNNSQYLQSYTPTTLWSYYTGLGNSLWCELTGCVMEGNIVMGDNDIITDFLWANDIQIWDDTLNADAILSMMTHDISNIFTLTVTDAGATDFYSGEQYQIRSADNLFQIIHDLYTGTYLNIDVGNTNPEITSKGGVISFVGDNLTTTGNITADYYFGDGSLLTGIETETRNIFDQDLNTTSSVEFVNLTVSNITLSGNIISATDVSAKMYFEDGYLVVEG